MPPLPTHDTRPFVTPNDLSSIIYAFPIPRKSTAGVELDVNTHNELSLKIGITWCPRLRQNCGNVQLGAHPVLFLESGDIMFKSRGITPMGMRMLWGIVTELSNKPQT